MIDPSADIGTISVPPETQALNDAAENAAAVAEATVKVNLQFPEIGFIDPNKELDNIRRAVDAMPPGERPGYPDKIRAKLLAWHANHENPAVSDEELACAIFIKRTTDSPLTAEDLETKATGKAPKKEKAAPKAKAKQQSLDDLLGL